VTLLGVDRRTLRRDCVGELLGVPVEFVGERLDGRRIVRCDRAAQFLGEATDEAHGGLRDVGVLLDLGLESGKVGHLLFSLVADPGQLVTELFEQCGLFTQQGVGLVKRPLNLFAVLVSVLVLNVKAHGADRSQSGRLVQEWPVKGVPA